MSYRLAIFDLDGTLTDTSAVDARCYAAALRDAFDVREVDTDWSRYGHVTDSGILREIFQERLERTPNADEESLFIKRFVEHLEGAFRADPGDFLPIQGAPSLTARLSAHPTWRFVLATGGWRDSAQLKLRYAGMEGLVPHLYGTAHDGVERTAIVEGAITQAQARYGGGAERLVLIGDAEWDVRTAAEMLLPFIGVATGEGAERLRAAGAATVVETLRGSKKMLELMDTAEVPAI